MPPSAVGGGLVAWSSRGHAHLAHILSRLLRRGLAPDAWHLVTEPSRGTDGLPGWLAAVDGPGRGLHLRLL